MYKVDRVGNVIVPLTERRFSELNFREREHLQIWIENHPEILGEELLIIQKEFDGWSGTSERLDLLALDKSGHVVVIENKLDSSGRDTVWQAMKYAAYCSTLDAEQIVSIYAKYLTESESVAEIRIIDFLEVGSLEESDINPGNQQRMILTARSFRTEVTATCLWLIGNNVRIRCVEIRPFNDGDDIYLSAEQIIPPPKSEEFMISMGAKEKSETGLAKAATGWKRERQEFFETLILKLDGVAAQRYSNRTPGTDHWLDCASGTSGIHFSFNFLKTRVRVLLSLGRAEEAQNKFIFDQLQSESADIEAAFSQELDWLRLNTGKASRISMERSVDMTNRDNWPETQEWMNEKMNRFIATFSPRLIPLVNSPEFQRAGTENNGVEDINDDIAS